MNIVYAMTRNVYHKILPSLRSLAEHHPDANVYILAEDNKLPFETPIDCKIINVSDQKYFTEEGCVNIQNRFGGYINLLKVYYPTYLPNIEKVIHLDIDTIICGSLDDFWNIDITNKWFAAVPETLAKHGHKPFGDAYYNMGVALINLEQMRKDKIESVMAKYLCDIEQPFADQDAWNKYGIAQNKIAILPLRFNENQSNGYTEDPAIVHYCGISRWYEDVTIPRRQYIEKYMDRKVTYMIHVCNDREWYVKDYLVPSMVAQGISEDDIVIWHDKDCIGNLASFVASCKWIAETQRDIDSMWHLQDDVVISKDFKEQTEKQYLGIANGFCNEQFDGERTNYLGVVTASGMWFSFQCVHIPNRIAAGFVDWFENDCVPNNLYPEYVESGRCDDSLFRCYVTENQPNIPAFNIYPNIVDHIDYLIGGTVINKHRIGKFRKSYWRNKALDEVVAELEEKLAKQNK